MLVGRESREFRGWVVRLRGGDEVPSNLFLSLSVAITNALQEVGYEGEIVAEPGEHVEYRVWPSPSRGEYVGPGGQAGGFRHDPEDDGPLWELLRDVNSRPRWLLPDYVFD